MLVKMLAVVSDSDVAVTVLARTAVPVWCAIKSLYITRRLGCRSNWATLQLSQQLCHCDGRDSSTCMMCNQVPKLIRRLGCRSNCTDRDSSTCGSLCCCCSYHRCCSSAMRLHWLCYHNLHCSLEQLCWSMFNKTLTTNNLPAAWVTMIGDISGSGSVVGRVTDFATGCSSWTTVAWPWSAPAPGLGFYL